MRSLLFLAFLAGCSEKVDPGIPVYEGPFVPIVGPEPEPGMTVASRSSLGLTEVVGVTKAPDGTLYVLDAWNGLYRMDGTTPVLFASADALIPTDLVDRRPFTDVAAIDDDSFAITVRSDGLLYEAQTGITTQHFCYEPGWTGDTGTWVENFQITDSAAFDGTNILAQPQTITGDNQPIATDLARFEPVWGTPIQWATIQDPTFRASALGVVSDGAYLLARGSLLLDLQATDVMPSPRVDLASIGVRRIEGMTVDGATLWVVDGNDQELVAITGW